MAKVIFYQKLGCINNGKQRDLLIRAGHQVEVHNLLKTSWDKATLRRFFGDLPVAKWFNPTAPRIKSEEIIPSHLDEDTALELMITDPLLIRRPLIQVGDVYQVGFDLEKIDAGIGLKQPPIVFEDLETCPRSHEATPCPS
jgi:nitrogenase-associated protein